MKWFFNEVIGHGPLAHVRLIVFLVIFPGIIAFLPSRLAIHVLTKKLNLQSSAFSPTAASASLAVLLVFLSYTILIGFINARGASNLAGSFALLMLTTVFFAPIVFILAPLFMIYLVQARVAVYEEDVFSRLFIYIAIVVCLILQDVWLALLLYGS